ETRFNDREIRGGREDFGDRSRISRTSVSGESRTTTNGRAEVRGGANSELRSGTNPADFSVRSSESSGPSGGEAPAGAQSRPGVAPRSAPERALKRAVVLDAEAILARPTIIASGSTTSRPPAKQAALTHRIQQPAQRRLGAHGE